MRRSFFFLLLAAPILHLNALQVGGLSYIKDFQPGETAEVKISLISDKNKPELVDLRLCDYWCNSQGLHFFEEQGQQIRSNLSWLTLGSHREIINPGQTKDVFVTIKAPQNEPLNGSYWGVLLIEPSDPLQTLVEPENGFQLHVKVRYAYHIVANLGKGTPALKIVEKKITEMDGKNYLAVDVANTGTLFLNPKMTIKLYNEEGKLNKTIDVSSERLYPGSSVRFLADSNDMSPGKYTAFLLLDNGDGRLFGDTFKITIPSHL